MSFNSDADMWNYLFNGGLIEKIENSNAIYYRYDSDRSMLVNNNGYEINYLDFYYHYKKIENIVKRSLYRRKWVKFVISGVLDNPNWFESKEQFDEFYKYDLMISHRSDEWEEKYFDLK